MDKDIIDEMRVLNNMLLNELRMSNNFLNEILKEIKEIEKEAKKWHTH